MEIDGASNNSVDDIRDLRERVKYVPSGGRYKVYIIDETHMLSGSAFNALLKTLKNRLHMSSLFLRQQHQGRFLLLSCPGASICLSGGYPVS